MLPVKSAVACLLVPLVYHVHLHEYLWLGRVSSTVENPYQLSKRGVPMISISCPFKLLNIVFQGDPAVDPCNRIEWAMLKENVHTSPIRCCDQVFLHSKLVRDETCIRHCYVAFFSNKMSIISHWYASAFHFNFRQDTVRRWVTIPTVRLHESSITSLHRAATVSLHVKSDCPPLKWLPKNVMWFILGLQYIQRILLWQCCALL